MNRNRYKVDDLVLVSGMWPTASGSGIRKYGTRKAVITHATDTPTHPLASEVIRYRVKLEDGQEFHGVKESAIRYRTDGPGSEGKSGSAGTGDGAREGAGGPSPETGPPSESGPRSGPVYGVSPLEGLTRQLREDAIVEQYTRDFALSYRPSQSGRLPDSTRLPFRRVPVTVDEELHIEAVEVRWTGDLCVRSAKEGFTVDQEREATTKNRQIAIGNMAQAFKMDGLAWDWGDGWRISDKGRRAIS